MGWGGDVDVRENLQHIRMLRNFLGWVGWGGDVDVRENLQHIRMLGNFFGGVGWVPFYPAGMMKKYIFSFFKYYTYCCICFLLHEQSCAIHCEVAVVMWCQAGLEEMLVSPATRDQDQIGGLQEKNKIGFDVHQICEHFDFKDWKMRGSMVEKNFKY